jgi:hypothetical protein
LAEKFEAGEFPNMTPADALHMLAAALPRHSEIDARYYGANAQSAGSQRACGGAICVRGLAPSPT